MADSAWVPGLAAAGAIKSTVRHTPLVRVTHWLTTFAFFALLVSGVEILISHPRFYWGEVGNVLTPPLFQIPIPASRGSVPTGYGFVLPDQNGWSRYLHFQAAWVAMLTGLYYAISSLITGHFRRNLVPAGSTFSARALFTEFKNHLRLKPPADADAESYNVLQRIAYLGVVFVLFPMMIWTGLAMSPAFTSAFPFVVTVLGGQQSARTIHFFVTVALVFFLFVHIGMVFLAGFKNRMKGMITGQKEQL